MTKHELVSLVKRDYPEYDHETPNNLLRLMARRLSAPGARAIQNFLMHYRIPTGLIAGWYHEKLSARQDKTMRHQLGIAQSLHEMDNILAANRAGLPRELLGQAHLARLQLEAQKELETHKIDEQIRLEEQRARIAVAQKREEGRNDLALEIRKIKSRLWATAQRFQQGLKQNEERRQIRRPPV